MKNNEANLSKIGFRTKKQKAIIMKLNLLTIALLIFHLSAHAQWEQVANTPFTKDHGIGFSIDGYGYVLTGGLNGQVFSSSRHHYKYDPVADSWEQLNDYPGPARGYGIGDVWNGKVYFGFGTNGGTLYNDLWSWDPSTNVFEELPSCPCSGRAHPAFVILDGKAYVGAGGGSAGNLADFWEFDIATETWAQIPDIPGNRHHPYQFAIDGSIYVGAGHLTSWYKYTPGGSWEAVAQLSARVAGAQFSHLGKGYALSGGDVNHNSFATGEFWEYDPVGDAWTALPAHPGKSRFGCTQFVIDDYIYLMGGYNRNDPTATMTGYITTLRYGLPSAGVDGLSANTGGKLYPNPVNDKLTISLNNEVSLSSLVNIYSVTGELTMSVPFNENIDVSSLNAGMYILEVVDNDISILKERISKK
jgi:N-acetylneuraminic acid mutarotase